MGLPQGSVRALRLGHLREAHSPPSDTPAHGHKADNPSAGLGIHGQAAHMCPRCSVEPARLIPRNRCGSANARRVSHHVSWIPSVHGHARFGRRVRVATIAAKARTVSRKKALTCRPHTVLYCARQSRNPTSFLSYCRRHSRCPSNRLSALRRSRQPCRP